VEILIVTALALGAWGLYVGMAAVATRIDAALERRRRRRAFLATVRRLTVGIQAAAVTMGLALVPAVRQSIEVMNEFSRAMAGVAETIRTSDPERWAAWVAGERTLLDP